jgi:tetratricopeptide (TPR) repeat protein
VSDSMDQEIRTLQSLFWSASDLDGLAFAPLADAFLRKGDVKEALDLLTDGTSRHPEYATGHVVATRLYLQQGMHSEAEFVARRVLELDPENIEALSSLTTVLEDRGDAEASGFRSSLIGLDPDADEARGLADVAEPDDTAAASAEDSVSELEPFAAAGEVDATEGGIGDAAAEIGVETLDVEDLPLEATSDAWADPEADTVELKALTPDALDRTSDADDEEEVFDLGAFAASEQAEAEPASEPDAVDLSALAPDPEPESEAMDLAALAPDEESEPEAEMELMDLGALAPDAEPEPEVEVMDLGALAPDPEPEAELEVMDLGALAPDKEAEPEVEAMDLGALAPDDVLDLSELAPTAAPEGDPEMDANEPIYTRTLAELYVRQGFLDQALDVFRNLLAAEPGATDIETRIAELEGQTGAPPPPVPEPDAPAEEEVERLARDLAEGGKDAHEVDTPFAWMEEEASVESEPAQDGPDVGNYFDDLLAWEKRESQ